MADTFDQAWERRYSDNAAYRNHYPWSFIVTFVFSERPRDKAREDTRVLEIGCGTANNLWFAAREGFQVAGVDGSRTAIDYARDWFAREGLTGDLRCADFAELPFPDASFDLAFDRAALSLTTRMGTERAMAELARVVRPGGKVLVTPYSDRCTSFHKDPDADGVIRGIEVGTVTGSGGQVRFFGLQEVRDLFRAGWRLKSLKHMEETEMTRPHREVHAEWHALAERL